MKTAQELKPNYGPVYAAALYPDLAKIFQKHGYALAVHGSLARDFDLIAVPWVEPVTSKPEHIFADIKKEFAVDHILGPESKPQGRMAYTICFGFGHCSADLSFVTTQKLVLPPDSTGWRSPYPACNHYHIDKNAVITFKLGAFASAYGPEDQWPPFAPCCGAWHYVPDAPDTEIDLTDAQHIALVNMRGGCTCFKSAPCHSCVENPTPAELEALGINQGTHHE